MWSENKIKDDMIDYIPSLYKRGLRVLRWHWIQNMEQKN